MKYDLADCQIKNMRVKPKLYVGLVSQGSINFVYGLTTVIIASELDSSLQKTIKLLHMYMFSSMGILAVNLVM